MSFTAAVIAGIVPMLIYPVFLYWRDRYEKEPLGLVAATFLWGFIPAALMSLITQVIIGVPFLMLDATGALADAVIAVAVAPVTEEIFKGAALLMIMLIWRHEFDGVFDGVIYGSLVGFGFAAIENILYFLDSDGSIVFSRAVLFGLNHALYTSLTGIGFGVGRHSTSRLVRWAAPLTGLVFAILVHAVHNTALVLTGDVPGLICLAIGADWMGILLVFVVMVAAIRRERRWIIDELREEVALRTLNADQYAVVASPLRRFFVRMDALFTHGLSGYRWVGRYHHTLTKLAYKKHAHRRRGDAGAPLAEIENLRREAAVASVELANLHSAS